MLDILFVACVLLLIVILITTIVAYINVVKKGTSYARRRVQNGDVYLDDVCSSKHLILTNQHTVHGVKKSKGGGNCAEGNLR